MLTRVDGLPTLTDEAAMLLDGVEQVTPEGTVVVRRTGVTVYIGDEDGWLTALADYGDEGEQMIYEGTDLTELAAAVRQVAPASWPGVLD